jgi:intracellular sulfur oxidation DsrE/DsrF family protein
MECNYVKKRLEGSESTPQKGSKLAHKTNSLLDYLNSKSGNEIEVVAVEAAIEIVKSKDDQGLSRDRRTALYCYLRPEERYI